MEDKVMVLAEKNIRSCQNVLIQKCGKVTSAEYSDRSSEPRS